MRHSRLFPLILLLVSGCAAFPDVVVKPQYHNPFPQLHRVAILPFFNLSEDPHVDGTKVALIYYEELQAIPGFEVLPIGVTKRKLEALRMPLNEGTDFQTLARELDVDVVLVGAITDFTPYDPPRMGLTVRWYAANPGFHPIPPGYGLPWGTAEEEYIPKALVREAEFELARQQLKTQTPIDPNHSSPPAVEGGTTTSSADVPHSPIENGVPAAAAGALPPDWPDPRGFIPPGPSPVPPEFRPQHEPIIRHTRIYHGNDQDFTQRLSEYYFLRDDARFGGWQGYLQRSEDFIRFCCYLHITETLAARGGADEPGVVWRWPISRYDR